MELTDTNVRNIPDGVPDDHERFVRALTGSHPTLRYSSEESDEESETISLFDQYVSESSPKELGA